jgi:butyryl-CoA dehydrogenase
MLLSEDHLAVQDAVRSLRAGRDRAARRAWDKSHHFPAAQLKGLAALGCYGVAVPAEWDGAGLDYLALALILEEIAAGDGGTSTVVSVNNCPVNAHPDGLRQRRPEAASSSRWRAASMLGAFCLTEPHVGSEAGGLRTTAVREGDHYVLNGVKQFITSGKNGDVAIVMAVTDKAAGKKGISAFLVPTTPGLHGGAAGRQDGPAQPATPRRSTSTTAACRPRTCLGDEGMG